jgi:glutathione S-transferase
MMKIWGRPAAYNVQKVLWACDELQLKYENIIAGQHYGINREPFFLEMNPNGRVPVIQEQDFILYESNAIIRYLWEKYGFLNQAKSLENWAKQDSWMDWTSATLYYPYFRDFYLYTTRTPHTEQDPNKIEQLLSQINPHLAIANQQLSKYNYIAGNDFSMADITFGVLVDKWERINIKNQEFIHITNYYEKLLTRSHFIHNVVHFSLNAI